MLFCKLEIVIPHHGCLYYLWGGANLSIWQKFRDGFALHYRKPLLCLPAACDRCGAPSSIKHALDCSYGGLVDCRHNEVRDAFGDLTSLVWSPVSKEPVACDGSAVNSDTLITDLCVHGVWKPQTNVLFDIRVIDTDSGLTLLALPLLCCVRQRLKRRQIFTGLSWPSCHFYSPMCLSGWHAWTRDRVLCEEA